MSFKWTDYLEVAGNLNKLSDEASWRSSISRSYYGLFGRLRTFCVNKIAIVSDVESKSAQCHILMYDRMVDQNNEELFLIAQSFFTLKKRREQADYVTFPQNPITKNLAVTSLEKSRQTIDLIVAYEI